MKLYTKFSIPLVILVISVSMLLNYFFIKTEEERMKDYIQKFGISLAKNLASNSELGVFTGNEAYLEKPVKAITGEKDVVFAFILDVEEPNDDASDNTWNVKERGKVLAHSDKSEVGKVYYDIYSDKAINSDDVTISQYMYGPTKEEIIDVSAPIFNIVKERPKSANMNAFLEEGGEELFDDAYDDKSEVKIKKVKKGVARVGIALTPIHKSLSQMKRKFLWISLGTIILMLAVLTSLFSFITKPILSLAEAAKNIAAGNYIQKVHIKNKDAIGTLANTFNYMSDNLNQSMKRMELTSNFNRSLILANNLTELLNTILTEILNAQGIKDGSIMLFNERRATFVINGTGTFLSYFRGFIADKKFIDWFVENKNISNIEDYLEKFAGDFEGEYEDMRELGVTMIIPLHTKDQIIGLFSFGGKSNGQSFADSDIKFLSNLIQSAVIAIDNIILREKEAENEVLKYELEFAKRVQQGLLPDANPKIKGFDIYTLCLPAKDIGGDYYDFLMLKEGCVGISIADVSGKGVPAALYMATTRSFLRSVAFDHDTSCATLSKINELLYSECGSNVFVTMFYAVVNAESKTLTYANAGHAFPMHYKDEADGRTCTYLINTGLPLGVTCEQQYSSSSVTLKQGELILFYTDGIVEAMNDEDDLFGFERLEELVKDYGHLTAKEFVDKAMESLRGFIGDNPLQDDLTLVAMKITD